MSVGTLTCQPWGDGGLTSSAPTAAAARGCVPTRKRRERQWRYARDPVLAGLVVAGVDLAMEGDGPRFHKMRMDLWSSQQQRRFARDLSGRLEARPVAEEMFGPHLTVDGAIGRVAEYLREQGLIF